MTPVIGRIKSKVGLPAGMLRKDFGLQTKEKKNHEYCILP
jgi:hypothetical protein